MAKRDDMVIRPRLDGGDRAAAPVRAREERRLHVGKKKARLFRRMMKARGARKASRAARGALKARKAARVARAAGGAGRSAAAIAGRGATRAAAAHPVGWVVAAVVIIGAVAGRLITGRSFENMGAQINKTLLGDLDEQARAAADTRQKFGASREVAEIVGREGRVNSQVSSIFNDMKKMRERELKGASLFAEDKDFQADSTIFDQVIVSARDAIVRGWNGADGADSLRNLQDKCGKIRQNAGKAGAR